MPKFESNSKDEAYYDRNQLALLCAKMAQKLDWKVKVKDEDSEWPIVLINLPNGQISYHIPREEMIGDFEIDVDETFWDGHFLEEKRENIREYLLEDLNLKNPRKVYIKQAYGAERLLKERPWE